MTHIYHIWPIYDQYMTHIWPIYNIYDSYMTNMYHVRPIYDPYILIYDPRSRSPDETWCQIASMDPTWSTCRRMILAISTDGSTIGQPWVIIIWLMCVNDWCYRTLWVDHRSYMGHICYIWVIYMGHMFVIYVLYMSIYGSYMGYIWVTNGSYMTIYGSYMGHI